MDLLSMYLKGGVIMHPILLCSVIALAIIIDRLIIIRRAKLNAPAFMIRIRGYLKKKDVEGAISFCLEEKSPTANMIRKGLKKYKHGHERVKEAIENAGKQEIAKLEKGLSALATIAGIAPMLGFLGTVTGMVSAFMTIQDLQGAASPSDLAGGIWEALITTVFGLVVGIPALAFYNYLLSRISRLVNDMEVISTEIVDTIEEVNTGGSKMDEEIEIDL
ncbi:MAG TPA: MotA/TolQ/ExbB proton channel family protein [Ignavibacteriales bacterium]|nr:MotA/TolQ/ExbB proton channel family protein [Ignavibacteriales bacterium]